MAKPSVIIVGAGIAGLCCARRLQEAGADYTVVEASDAVGGRMRSDRLDGFVLDRGFQVLLTAYPECRAVLDYDALELQAFDPGTLIRRGGKFHRLADPWRRPTKALGSLFSAAGTLGDKWGVARLRSGLRQKSIEEIFASPERSTLEELEDQGFSPRIIESFFRPFLGGVFLDRELATTSRMFEFVFKMFAEGEAALPSGGIQAIPESVAAGLRPGSVRLGAPVEQVDPGSCLLAGGERLEAEHVVVATDGTEATRLGRGTAPQWRGTVCFYFDAPEPPLREPVLVLAGEGAGPVNNLCVVTNVAPATAPAGRTLVSVSTVGLTDEDEGELERAVRGQLRDWFGAAVERWRLIRAYRIGRALPALPAGALDAARGRTGFGGTVVCGDHTFHGSIHGAMLSGRRAAESILGVRAAAGAM
jgi:phytoene dehydrogenase-like protein